MLLSIYNNIQGVEQMANAIYIEEQLMQDAEQILEKLGLDATTVAKMALKRVVRDGGISFLIADLPKIEVEPTVAPSVPAISNVEQDRITKSAAANLFNSKGYTTNRNVTFASKNKVGNYYWANPLFDALNQDWYLILNDWIRKELHLFKIPIHTLKASDLISRSDNEEKIDLQIAYNDTTFTDNRSKISFAQFLVTSITY